MDWKDAVNYGLPTVLLMGLLYVLLKVMMWMKNHVAEPVVKSHLELIQLLKEQVPEQGRNLVVVADVAKKVAEVQETQMDEVKDILEKQTETIALAIEHQTEMLKDIKDIKGHNRGAQQPPGATTGPEAGGPS